MRLALGLGLALFGLVGLVGCGGGNNGDDGTAPDAVPAPAEGFQIITPDIVIPAGGEETYCYYTTVTLDQATGIKRWSSVMTPGSHHLIVFFTPNAEAADGTLTANCGFATGGGSNLPVWTYSAAQPEAEMVMPDGVGMQIAQTQHLFIQMHYLNTDPVNDLTVHVTVNGDTYAADEQYTPAAAYVTYSTDISIDPAPATGSNEHTCAVPSDATFFTIGTHSHRRSTLTWIKDGSTEIYRSDNWEHPQDVDQSRYDSEFAAPTYYNFSGDLTYHCDYQNDLDQQVTSGDSAATNEMCMAVGYFYPATSATFCINGFVF